MECVVVSPPPHILETKVKIGIVGVPVSTHEHPAPSLGDHSSQQGYRNLRNESYFFDCLPFAEGPDGPGPPDPGPPVLDLQA